MPAFLEFCCRAGGNNLNAGTVDGGSTEPATTPLVTYVGGNWDATTDIYTAPVGADMTEAVVGRYASLYHDGDTAPTTLQYLIARINVVNAGTRQITLSTTQRIISGTEVATGTGNRSMRIGGAWAGPSGAIGFPMTFMGKSISGTTTVAMPRVNYKNDQVYAVTASIAPATNPANGPVWHWGYTSTYADGGYAQLSGGVAGASYSILNPAANNWCIAYFDFVNNGATGSTTAVLIGVEGVAYRCKVHGMRGGGIYASGALGCVMIECEAYGNNTANIANIGGLGGVGTGAVVRCVSRDNTGTNASGFYLTGNGLVALDCLAYGNGAHGFQFGGSATEIGIGCTAYANGQSGFQIQNGGDVHFHLENCVAVANTFWGITLNTTATGRNGLILNCAFGDNPSGQIQANNFGQCYLELGTVTLGAGVRPWVDAAGDSFTINHSALRGKGRGDYLQSDGGVSFAYRDIGAAQSQPYVPPILALGM
jgi:hypothetical protein